MVLAAGFGTRLAPLSDEIPKPLVPIGNRPLLHTVLDSLKDRGAEPLCVNAHYRAQDVEDSVRAWGAGVHVSHEETILGTAGGAARVARQLDVQSLVLANGDIFGHLPWPALMEGAFAGLLLAVVVRSDADGTVGIGRRGQVVRLRGQVFGEEVTSGDYMGFAHLGPSCLATLPKEGCLIGDWAIPHLRRGGEIRTVAAQSDFIDVGSLQSYLLANCLEADRAGGAILGKGAEVGDEVTLSRSVIGAGASIDGRGKLHECVVLPGAHARAPLSRVVVTPSGCHISVDG